MLRMLSLLPRSCRGVIALVVCLGFSLPGCDRDSTVAVDATASRKIQPPEYPGVTVYRGAERARLLTRATQSAVVKQIHSDLVNAGYRPLLENALVGGSDDFIGVVIPFSNENESQGAFVRVFIQGDRIAADGVTVEVDDASGGLDQTGSLSLKGELPQALGSCANVSIGVWWNCVWRNVLGTCGSGVLCVTRMCGSVYNYPCVWLCMSTYCLGSLWYFFFFGCC